MDIPPVSSSGIPDKSKPKSSSESPQVLYLKIRRGMKWTYWSEDGEVDSLSLATEIKFYREAKVMVQEWIRKPGVDACEVEIVTR